MILICPRTKAASPLRTSALSLRSRRLLSALIAASVGVSGLTLAAPVAPLPSVQAWTNSAQTYIRARPGETMPPVAKVARHMSLVVWGKFQGWYRVETHDHIFGWVYHDDLNSPRLHRVEVLSAAKARSASDRTSDQVMFGTVPELRAYLERYNAVGAAKGLALHGIYVSPRAARGEALPRQASTNAPTRNQAAMAPRFAAAARFTPAASTTLVTPSTTLVAPPTREELMQRAPQASAPDQPTTALAATRRSQTERQEPRAGGLNPSGQTTPQRPRLAMAPRSFAPAAPSRVSPAVPSLTPPVNVTTPRVASAPKTAVKKSLTWRQRRYLARLNAKKSKRDQLRSRLGWPVPAVKVAPPTVAPFAPDELVKARESFLQAQRSRTVAPVAPVAPAVSDSPFETVPDAGAALAPAPPTVFTPSSAANASATLSDGLQSLIFGSAPQRQAAAKAITQLDATRGNASTFINERGERVADPLPSLTASAARPASALTPVVISSAQVAPNGQLRLVSRGGSPTRAIAPLRGGSPTARAAAAWNQGVANQALSYRGMPYRFGAASPRRGFDCSGLVYFLLRQRGYKPPRTAAGYRNFGNAVSRGQWKTGDLILFANTYKRGVSHIGVYLKDGKFVHAATTGSGVRVDSLSGYYAAKYWGARRVR